LLGPLVCFAAEPAESPARAEEHFEGTIAVHFATNRNRIALDAEENPRQPEYFGDARGELRFGVCRVEFKNIWGLSKITQKLPFYLPPQSRNVVAMVPLTEDAFWERTAGDLEGTDRLVGYIHGYNIGFRKACQRAAVFQNGTGLAQRMAMFSWPSKGRAFSYTHDEADVNWSTRQIEGFVKALIREAGAGRVDLVAHSLGTRGLVEALYDLGCVDSWQQAPPIRHLVLLAPDIDAATFRQKVERIHRVARHITVYASDSDRPLQLSHELHGYPRLGQAGPHLTVLPGIETVDVSAAAAYELTGHQYHLYHPAVTADILRLLTTGESAAQRPGLEKRSRDGMTYWAIRVEPQ
jgi:esterase/lipase superfamily enzyme